MTDTESGAVVRLYRWNMAIARERAIEAARLSAKMQGCCCEPDVHLRELRPGVFSTEVKHDSWCRLVGGTGEA